MAYEKLLSIVKTLRFGYAIAFVLMLAALYWFGIHPWMMNWGSTAAERQMVLPGDELRDDSAGYTTMAVTIHAAPEIIWQWLVQVGQDRAGFYTYTWLENILGADIHNANEIHPEWQNLSVGEGAWRMLPSDYLGGAGEDSARQVLIYEPGYALVLEMWGAYVILPVSEQTSRLIMRGESGKDSLIKAFILDPTIFTMARRMLLGIQARAEGRPDSPVVLMTIAWFGWVAAGILAASLFIRVRTRKYWIALPILATLPALFMGHDFQAALVAFVAAGITIGGFLVFGKNWWGPIIIIGSIVMLILLLAQEAFTTFGMVFILLLLPSLSLRIPTWHSGLAILKRKVRLNSQKFLN